MYGYTWFWATLFDIDCEDVVADCLDCGNGDGDIEFDSATAADYEVAVAVAFGGGVEKNG